MFIPPVAVALKVCRETITDRDTGSVSLIHCLKRIECDRFPSRPQNLTVCAILTGSIGEFQFRLDIVPLSTMVPFVSRSWPARLDDRAEERWSYVKIRGLVFREEARHQFSL